MPTEASGGPKAYLENNNFWDQTAHETSGETGYSWSGGLDVRVRNLRAGLSGTFAQSCPDRPITMVVPFLARGPTDTVGRLIAEKTSAELGQQIIVESVGRAGGMLGAGQVAGAEADGTRSFCTTSA
jgi:Tripartite tricarboxylate transporter family receptor